MSEEGYSSTWCPHCNLSTGMQHESHCPFNPMNRANRPIYVIDDSGKMTISKIGWECPVCHRGLSPDVLVCDHTGTVITISGNQSDEYQWDSISWYEQE